MFSCQSIYENPFVKMFILVVSLSAYVSILSGVQWTKRLDQCQSKAVMSSGFTRALIG